MDVGWGGRGAKRVFQGQVYQLNLGTVDQILENPNTVKHPYLHVSYFLVFIICSGRGWIDQKMQHSQKVALIFMKDCFAGKLIDKKKMKRR